MSLKKMLFGGFLFFGGLIGVVALAIAAALKPWAHAVPGVLGSMLASGLIVPFVISVLLLGFGLYLLYRESNKPE